MERTKVPQFCYVKGYFCDNFRTRFAIYNVVFILLLASSSSLVYGCNTEDAECQNEHYLRLNHDLFERDSYNHMIRPVVNTSDSLTINFTLALSTIINVDSKNQVIITNVWLQMYWYDYQLEWDPKDYGNITETRGSADIVWVPDIVLFNNADGNYEPSFSPNVVLYSTGSVKYIPTSIYTSSCDIDVEYFPFDQQVCQMKFGSWTFQGKTLNFRFQFNQNEMDMSDYMRNGAWDIIAVQGYIEEHKDSITGGPKELIVYDLVIRRKTLFYTVNLIIPCFLHALVCLCVFLLPADGCEKVTLVISVLVSLVVFLNLVQKILPPSMKIPLIAKYFLFTFIMTVLETLNTVIIIFVNHKSPRPKVMPKWVCWLLLYKLPKWLLMERPDHDERWQPKKCTAPPSYPSTPQIPRASMRVDASSLRQRPNRDGEDKRQKDRVSTLRKNYKLHHGYGSSTHSSGGSGSQASADDYNTGQDWAESRGTDRWKQPLPAFNGHHCMLHDSARGSSHDSLDSEETPLSLPPRDPQQRCDAEINPLWLTREVYSGVNAVKFIWRQMQNQEEYETVLDDWKYVAAVLDRLFMVIFVLVTTLGTLSVLVNAPHILETVDEEKIIQDIRDRLAG